MTSRRLRWLLFVFLAPTVLLLGTFLYYPMVGTVIESFYKSSFINPNPTFAGFEQYRKILGSRDFREVLVNSVAWTVGVVALQNLLGFGSALLLNAKVPGRGLMRALVMLPWVLPGVVAAILWRFMYDPQLGLINSFLIRLGVLDEGTAWLADTSTAMPAVVFAAVWKGFPFCTLIYLAALQNIDREQLEAAMLDGARAFGRLVHVVIPGLREIIAVNVVLTTILTFNYFDMVWVLTRGGPKNATHIFPTRIFELGFGQFRFGEASTYGVFSILVLALLVTLYVLLRSSRQRS